MIETVLQHSGEASPVSMENLAKIATFTLLGVLYSLARWFRERSREDSPESFSVRKAAQTALIGAVAGAITATQTTRFDQATFQASMALAIPIVNELLNAAKTKRRK